VGGAGPPRARLAAILAEGVAASATA
jgi:hypothetical protein